VQYAFRETLNAFDIQGPRVDWSSVRVAPGFSVRVYTFVEIGWKLGYDQPSTVENILAITDPLLDGMNPPGRDDLIR
jgi:hypothetical protein